MNRIKLLHCAAIALSLCAAAQAQTVYRIVGADGKVTFSDTPPSALTKARSQPLARETPPHHPEAHCLSSCVRWSANTLSRSIADPTAPPAAVVVRC